MPRMLITLSLGPVQSLIEAARRTRDLWGGSWLLSEVSRAAARELHRAQPGGLIFPYLDQPERDLQPLPDPGDEANIANILRAEVELPDAAAARALCEQAKTAARERLIDIGDQARGRLAIDLREEVWNAQIGDLLEVFAAWALIPDGEDGYRQASRALGATLAARKATRDFAPAAALSSAGLPKSSLDGALETVLPDKDAWPAQQRDRRKLGLARGEQLDALGVIKRLAGEVEQFTAYSRIAADPWIDQLSREDQQRLADAYAPLVKAGLATRVSGNLGLYGALPYDAQLLYDFRLQAALGAKGEDSPDDEARQALSTLGKAMRALPKQAGAPTPYAAILKADGDRMGQLLQQARGAEDSRAISHALHGFASEVREQVRVHRGHAIYAGGDDVLALVPLPNAVPCAKALAEAFAAAMGGIAGQLGVADSDKPTLSAGIGIGHLMEPLGRLRTRAGNAEHLAKGDATKTPRNALALCLGIRSGSELAWRANWDDDDAFTALDQFTTAYRDGQLPSRVAYDLRATDQRLRGLQRLGATVDDVVDNGMRRAEVARTLDRARAEGGNAALGEAMQRLILHRADKQSLAALADTLILARWLSARTAADLGERGQ